MNRHSYPPIDETTTATQRAPRDDMAGWVSVGAALCLLCYAALRRSRIAGVVALLTKVAFGATTRPAVRITTQWKET